MASPSPTVFLNGLGSVGADQLNTFVQVVTNFAQLRTFTGLSNMVVCALGQATANDGFQGHFYWNPTSTTPDNNTTVIVPNGAIQGAWIRLTGI